MARKAVTKSASFHVVVINEVESMRKSDVAIKYNFLVNLFAKTVRLCFFGALLKLFIDVITVKSL